MSNVAKGPSVGRERRLSLDSLCDGAESPHPVVPVTAHKPFPRTLLQWTWELAAALAGLAAMAAFVATLKVYDGQTNPQFAFDLSINTLLSVYSIVFGASVAIIIESCIGQQQWHWFRTENRASDVENIRDAGSGGWGSWMWLFKHRFQQPLTSLGAIFAILTVAVDPFAQQLLSYDDCQRVNKNAVTSMPRTSFIDSTNLYGYSTFVPPLQRDILGAMFSNKTPTLEPQCASGNCTFAPYSTAGYCNSCEDISSSLKFRYCNGTNGATCIFSDAINPYNLKVGNYSLHAMWQNITTLLTGSDHDGRKLFTSLWESSAVDRSLLSARTIGSKPLEVEILVGRTGFHETGTEVSGEKTTTCASPLQGDWHCKAGAARCRLFPCVKTYETTVNAGQISERLIGTTDLDTLGTVPSWNPARQEYRQKGWFPILLNTTCASPAELERLTARGYNTTGSWMGFDLFGTTNALTDPVPANTIIPRRCMYMWDPSMDDHLAEFFGDTKFMNGVVDFKTWTPHGSGVVVDTFVGNAELVQLYNSSYVSFEDVTVRFDNVVSTLTNYMRAHGNANHSDPAVGTVWTHNVCVHVSWPWLSLLVVVYLGAVVLLVSTMVSATRSKVPVWKASLLPYLFHGPPAQDPTPREVARYSASSDLAQNHLRDLRSEKGDDITSLETAAKAMYIRLGRSGAGAGLLQAVERGPV